DRVATSVSYMLAAGQEIERLDITFAAGTTAINLTGNEFRQSIIGNAGDNVLNGGGGADLLQGLGGNDSFVFRAGEAQGDVVVDFAGNGASAGDSIRFEGYGTAAQGATFVQINATQWQVNSADGLIHEVVTFSNAAALHTSDFLFV
ncbi:Ca2+-binding RTX toxin-like protein, partial [Bradyrhizobium sp. I1.7.5]